MHDLYGEIYPKVKEGIFSRIEPEVSGIVGRLIKEFCRKRNKEIKDFPFRNFGISSTFVESVIQGYANIASKEMLERIITVMALDSDEVEQIWKAFDEEYVVGRRDESLDSIKAQMMKVYVKPATLMEIFVDLKNKTLADIYNPVMLFFGYTPESLDKKLFGIYQGIKYVLAGIRVPYIKKIKAINKALGISVWDADIIAVAGRTAEILKKARQAQKPR
jgi:hypothetical protein